MKNWCPEPSARLLAGLALASQNTKEFATSIQVKSAGKTFGPDSESETHPSIPSIEGKTYRPQAFCRFEAWLIFRKKRIAGMLSQLMRGGSGGLANAIVPWSKIETPIKWFIGYSSFEGLSWSGAVRRVREWCDRNISQITRKINSVNIFPNPFIPFPVEKVFGKKVYRFSYLVFFCIGAIGAEKASTHKIFENICLHRIRQRQQSGQVARVRKYCDQKLERMRVKQVAVS